ncbi:MAG TPA: hypothetical protein VM366_04340 [Anaerolineae bacterium]|nr:hypothetical protein [Anaerolineae bacterium]
MVQPGIERAHLVGWCTDKRRQLSLYVEGAVTQADHGNAGCHPDGPAVRGHGIAIVDEPCIRAEGVCVSCNVHQRRDHAHGTRDAARHDGVAHRLVDAVLARDQYVSFPRPAPAHADRRHDHVRPGQHAAPVGRGLQGDISAARLDHTPHKLLRCP